MKQRELDERLELLRSKYQEFSRKYGKKNFNNEAFEKRCHDAVFGRINLEVFIKAEEEALTQLYTEYMNPKKTEKLSERPDSFTNKVNKIIEEYDQRIKLYPYVNFHQEANEEIKYLYGAVRFFYQELFPHLEKIYGNRALGITMIRDFSNFYSYLDYYARESGTGYSRRIEDHLIKLRHYSNSDTAQDYRNFIIETAQYFNKLEVFIGKTMERFSTIDEHIHLTKAIFGNENMTYAEFLNAVDTWIQDLFHNFRFDSLI